MIRAWIRPLLFIAIMMLAFICSCSPRIQVTPIANGSDIAALGAKDIVVIMDRAGFSKEQILDHGTRLRNLLAQTGAAQIDIGKNPEAIFAVRGSFVHVSSRSRGSFIYDFANKTFR